MIKVFWLLLGTPPGRATALLSTGLETWSGRNAPRRTLTNQISIPALLSLFFGISAATASPPQSSVISRNSSATITSATWMRTGGFLAQVVGKAIIISMLGQRKLNLKMSNWPRLVVLLALIMPGLFFSLLILWLSHLDWQPNAYRISARSLGIVVDDIEVRRR